jgi:hypothetical protein
VAGQSPAAANDQTYRLTLYVVGDPSTPVSTAIIGDLSTLSANPSARMASYQATPAGATTMPFPTVRVNCSDGSIRQPAGTLSTGFGLLPPLTNAVAADYTLVCPGVGATVSSFAVQIPITGASCLVPSGMASGTYNLTSTQRNLVVGTGANGVNLPNSIVAPNPPIAAPQYNDAPWLRWSSDYGLAQTFPAFVASNGGAAATFNPNDLFNPSLTFLLGGVKYVAMGAYMPAVRGCAPTTPTPGSAVSGGGISAGLADGPISNGGAQLFSGTDLNGVTGVVRALALPKNAGASGASPWGGYRNSGYARCAAVNSFGATCQLTDVPVTVGGSGTPKKWTTVGCGGQFVDVRVRATTWLGLSQYSAAAQTAGLTGCS